MSFPNKTAPLKKTSPLTIHLNGNALQLLPDGALFWPEKSLLVVSDLHLEKASSFASKTGQFLPPYDSRSTLERVWKLCEKFKPRQVISLGDSFHDIDSDKRLHANDATIIRKLTAATNWVWVEGNHDPIPPQHLGGTGAHEVYLDNLVFRHEPTGEKGEVAGHLHPAIRVKTHQGYIRRRCFAYSRKNLIMPAIGSLTGSLNITHPVFGDALGDEFSVGVLRTSGVVSLEIGQLNKLRDKSRGSLARRLKNPVVQSIL